MTMSISKEVAALLSLVDDPDVDVFHAVKERILDLGKEMIPSLEDLSEVHPHPHVQHRVDSIIHKIHFNELQKSFCEWAAQDEPDLMYGAFLVSRYKFPDLIVEDYQTTLDRICKSIWLELNNYLTPLEQINVVNRIFYAHHMFRGVEISYSHQEDFLISKLLDTRRGNPISNGILYQSVCQKLDIPVRAIHIPRQFILGFFENPEDVRSQRIRKPRILFYIDPISGQVYAQKDVDHYLDRIQVSRTPNCFQPMDNRAIIGFLIEEFSKCFDDEKSRDKQNELRDLGGMLLEKRDQEG
jgi:regulator of sirC expression with transglutaminase-like and TPR domain